MAETINKRLWNNYSRFAKHRGWLVTQLLADYIALEGAAVADLGSGSGGIALALAAAGASVTAIDFNTNHTDTLSRVAERERLPVTVLHADLDLWQPLRRYGAIVLWDVLEHVREPEKLLQKCYHSLSDHGIVCLATPNKWSPPHLLADPHYSIPLLACAPRSVVKKVIVDGLHLFDNDKRDVAQLLSYAQLTALVTAAGFKGTLITRRILELALARPESVWNRPWHLSAARFLARPWVTRSMFRVLQSEEAPLIRSWLPTLYMILRKDERAVS